MLRKLFAIGLGVMGIIYVLQGTGIYTPMASFMYRDPRWAIAGLVLVALSVFLWVYKKKT